MLLLVLGLGNIGEKYKNNRHNVGFKVIEQIIKNRHLSFQPPTSEYHWAVDKKTEVIFAMPKTYINNSGKAALALLKINNLTSSQMLVVVDDFNLPLGKIRIRKSGSDGGHNGLVSIIDNLQTENFPRLRLGIGPLPDKVNKADFVLSDFNDEEEEPVQEMINVASEAVLYSLEFGLEAAMSKYNGNPA